MMQIGLRVGLFFMFSVGDGCTNNMNKTANRWAMKNRISYFHIGSLFAWLCTLLLEETKRSDVRHGADSVFL